MSKFEVFIPPADPQGMNVTLRVDAANWMAALKIGLMRIGEQGASVQNILVDIQDDQSVHVTESSSGRVFRLRELTDAEAEHATVKPQREPFQAPAAGPSAPVSPTAPTLVVPMPAVPAAAAPAQPAAPAPAAPTPDTLKTLPGIPLQPAQPAAPKPPPKRPTTGRFRKSAVPTRAGAKELMAETVIELAQPTQPVKGQIGRSKSPKDKKAELEDMLSEVFERAQEVYAQKDPQAAMYFLLDLALAKIPAESGSVFQANAGNGDLTFWAARGPKAQDLLGAKIIVPAGVGIVGFCSTEGVSVALSEVRKDPRFYSAVSDKVQYETRSVLCCPMMTHGRSFGCMQILNKKEDALFTEHEVGLLAYVAHQAAMYLNSL